MLWFFNRANLHTKIIGILRLNLCKRPGGLCFLRFKSSDEAMRVLNVAEKNDAAKHIAGYLSRGTSRRREGLSQYNKIYEFKSHVWNQDCEMIMTSVSGHLLTYEFLGNYRKWNGCHPLSLFDAPVNKICSQENYSKIKQTLEREAKKCSALIIWTDCDREGENIGFEIINVCRSVRANIKIYRAIFSEITEVSVTRALRNLSQPNKAVSDAVDVRSELDLRIGAAFTRFQTLRFRKVFPNSLADLLISYGSCQFPTLGFVVERFLAIARFQSEPYWKLKVMDVHDNISVEFRWARGRLFEQLPCEVFLEMCQDQPNATVLKVTSKPKSKWRPLPLDTVELEKQGSRKLRLTAKETMKIAEKLYTQGLISYPRTETNIFPKELNLVPLVNQQGNNPSWGNFALRIVECGLNPRDGKKSDKAHPPIHPIKYTDSLEGNEAKVYEFIVRHFLACLSSNAVGQETTVEIDIAGERFYANGLQILAKNYLEVYIYERWSDKEIHMYQQGQTFTPTSIDMVQERTSPPPLLTEADLIALMDKFGIGTDATHAEHIDTIKSRHYIGLVDGKHLMPGKLGIGLVEGYDNMGFQMSKPNLRAELERDLKLICDGQKNPQEVLQSQINKYRDVFKVTLERANLIDGALANHLEEQPIAAEEIQMDNLPEDTAVLKCPKCGSDMTLKSIRANGKKFIGCMAYPTCNNAIWFTDTIQPVEVLNEVCSQCSGNIRKLKFEIHRNAYPTYGPTYVTCIGGCDATFNELLQIRNDSIRRSNTTNDSGFHSTSNTSRSTILTNPTPARSNAINRPTDNRSRVNSSANTNTSTGLVRTQNNNRRPANGSRDDDRGSKKRKNPRSDDTWIDTSNFNSESTTLRAADQSDMLAKLGHIDENTVIVCTCNETANRLTVKKEGPNKGRVFYKCAKLKGTDCNFFLWESDDGPETRNNVNRNFNDPVASTSNWGNSSNRANTSNWGNTNSWGNSNNWANTSNRANSSNRANTNNWENAHDSSSNDVMCRCNLQAKQRTVQKDGPNKGRLFYSCPKFMNESCGFFEWVDEGTEIHNQSYGDRSNNTGRGGGTARGNRGNRGNRANTGNKRKCGVCGVEGHTRRTCPQNVLD